MADEKKGEVMTVHAGLQITAEELNRLPESLRKAFLLLWENRSELVWSRKQAHERLKFIYPH